MITMMNKEVIINVKDLKQKDDNGEYKSKEVVRFKNQFVYDFISNRFGIVNMINSDEVDNMTQIQRHLASSHSQVSDLFKELINDIEFAHTRFKWDFKTRKKNLLINSDVVNKLQDLVAVLDKNTEEKMAYNVVIKY